ncbi:MAG: (2Fe-2S)-binding protein [Planctomycetota bacterium]
MSRSPDSKPPRGAGVTRRTFLVGAGVAAGGALGAAPATGLASTRAKQAAEDDLLRLDGPFVVSFRLNGKEVRLPAEPRTTLLSLLRHAADPPLTGTKEGCDRGSCGACTVLLDGQPVYACLTLAGNLFGCEVTTVEGLGTPEELSTVQEAFWKHDALMCGFCTPGFVVAVTACLNENPAAGAEEIRSACAGNICRCGTYPQIVAAALAAGARMQEGRR